MDHDNQPEQQPRRNVYRDDPEYRKRLLEQKKREYQDPEHRDRLLGAMRARYWRNPEQSRQRSRKRRETRLAKMPEEKRKQFEQDHREQKTGSARDRRLRERLAASAVYKQYRGLEPGWPEVPPPGLTVALHPGSARQKRNTRTPAAVLVRPYVRQMEPPEDRLAALVPSVLADATLDLDDSRVKDVITARTNQTGLDATKALDEAKAWQNELGKAMFGSGIPGPSQMFGHLDDGLYSALEAEPGMFGAPYADEMADQVFDTGQRPPVPPVMNPFESSTYDHLPPAPQGTLPGSDDALSRAVDQMTIAAPMPLTDTSARGASPAGPQQVPYGQGNNPWPPGPQFQGGPGAANAQAPFVYGPASGPAYGGQARGYAPDPPYLGGAGAWNPEASSAPGPAAPGSGGQGGQCRPPAGDFPGGFTNPRPRPAGPGPK
ncbi:hypothetical protein OG946_24480 [Streptomyces sp. NBC_01808]|uniref:hypothetical protein n=1 Tax=Streptomyces sp. NBC_01808 TaxID=2975947 RepID=UPI002DDB166D|nr:hypothetical protein [Streptomyces sp. NBC_01808]WSA40242.1 hypothetical protein OG946_24480 [Streptomyces sp. NBC_01808]